MSVPSPDALTARIADKAGVDPQVVKDVLAGQGVSLVPVPPAQRRLDVRRLTIAGTKVNTQWAGPFQKAFDFTDGVTALITDQNLRGKSTILELITWALRGSPREELRADVRPWFDRIALEYEVNGSPMAVVLSRRDSGFIADILRAETPGLLRDYLDGKGEPEDVHVIASGLSALEFAQQQDQHMLALLNLEPMSNFQKFKGSDQGRPAPHTWPAYFGGLYLPSAASDILFGDTVFASLPARILQMYCNVPLMGAFIRLTTLSKQVKQDETNQGRRVAEDATARSAERAALVSALARVEQQLVELPVAKGRPFDVIVADLRDAETALSAASASSREASGTVEDAKATRQAEERRANNAREDDLARLLFQGILPKRCPRCEQGIEHERTELERSDLQCAVCTKDIPPLADGVSDFKDPDGVDGHEVDDEMADSLEALRLAESAAKATADAAREKLDAARAAVEALAAELTAASQAKEHTDRFDLRVEAARLNGAIGVLREVGVKLEPTESLRVLQAATTVLRDVTSAAASALFAELNAEIVALGRKFGIDNLQVVELDRAGGMTVTTAGEASTFRRVSGGERLRLRVAVVVALLRIGHRAGVGSHPGLILLDSPGSDELTVEHEAMLLRELDSLKAELPGLQVVIASAEPAAVRGHLPDESIYASLDGSPLW